MDNLNYNELRLIQELLLTERKRVYTEYLIQLKKDIDKVGGYNKPENLNSEALLEQVTNTTKIINYIQNLIDEARK